ncbi:hypothetical protein CSC2_08200 [Clostridium zeae]|uniref:Uncharacterized protein n=1 Tax=Clostridium zeae TaxID=2759022 RepID=A0ABQ1E6C5_9CLOT|nr:hypothetical protein CSC2_08200 [Clostridium zeae]
MLICCTKKLQEVAGIKPELSMTGETPTYMSLIYLMKKTSLLQKS